MPISYSTIYNCCAEKCRELGIQFDFNNNEHLQHPTTMNDLYKNLVYHSQNRSQGCAINFFKANNDGLEEVTERIWNIISRYEFDLNNKYDYLNLFSELKEYDFINNSIHLEKGKDIQYIELSKTCQCIKRYLMQYDTIDDFIEEHTFSSNAENNWRIIKNVANNIYNMSTELVPDFFKEQDCIIGREFLVKADIHVKRFFENICNRSMSDIQVYKYLMNLYNETDINTKNSVPPYKVDKLIYLIGEHLGNPGDSKEFANWVLQECQN